MQLFHIIVVVIIVFLIFSRELAETSPYYEALKKDDVEVGFMMR